MFIEADGLECDINDPKPLFLPPVCEMVWHSDDILKISQVIEVVYGTSRDNFKVHDISRKSKAIKCGNFVISGCNSRHLQSCIVFAKKLTSSEITLAELYYFTECTFTVVGPTNDCHCLCVAALKWYMDHPCRVWYGHPTQVWSCTQCTELDFIPVSYTTTHCVYQSSRQFWTIYGNTR